jgi:hemerythrin superfamily protein
MDAVTLLKQDHQQVAELFKRFENAGEDEKTSLAGQICQLLTVHAQIEEELLYPAAREVLEADDQDLVDEATVEHASVKDLVGQIETVDSADKLFAAKVTVLGEYVTHHVKEEESELFPKLSQTDLDLEELGDALATRKGQLMEALGVSDDDAVDTETHAPENTAPAPKDRTLRRAAPKRLNT